MTKVLDLDKIRKRFIEPTYEFDCGDTPATQLATFAAFVFQDDSMTVSVVGAGGDADVSVEQMRVSPDGIADTIGDDAIISPNAGEPWRYAMAEGTGGEWLDSMKLLRLPLSAIVSDGTIYQALVRIDASDMDEWLTRTSLIRDVLVSCGIELGNSWTDHAFVCHVPSNGWNLVDVAVGCISYAQWTQWLESVSKEIGPMVPNADMVEGLSLPRMGAVEAADPPAPAPELLGGWLRQGHTGLIIARAKSGKSWLCAMLAVSVCMGKLFLSSIPTRRQGGRVLVVDPELDQRSLSRRFHAVADALGANAAIVDSRVIRWSLRGAVTPSGNPPTIVDVAHDLQRYVENGELHKGDLSLIIVDSSSALMSGDENSALDVRRFHAHLLRIAEMTGAAVVAVHHEGKTASGDLDAISRGRGSSAWGDCFDLVLSLTEVFPPSGAPSDFLKGGCRAFRLEAAAVREFAQPDPLSLIWAFPLFLLDTTGTTADWKPRSGQRTGGKSSGQTRADKAALRASECVGAILAHLYAEDIGSEGLPLRDAVEVCKAHLGESVSSSTVKGYVMDSDLLQIHQPSPRKVFVVPTHPKMRKELF